VSRRRPVVGFCSPIATGKKLRGFPGRPRRYRKKDCPPNWCEQHRLANTRDHGPNGRTRLRVLLDLTAPASGTRQGRAARGVERQAHLSSAWWNRPKISRRAQAFGMRVMAVDPKEMDRPASSSASTSRPVDGSAAQGGRGGAGPVRSPRKRPDDGAEAVSGDETVRFLINVGRGGLVRTRRFLMHGDQKRLGERARRDRSEPLADDDALRKLLLWLSARNVGGHRRRRASGNGNCTRERAALTVGSRCCAWTRPRDIKRSRLAATRQRSALLDARPLRAPLARRG